MNRHVLTASLVVGILLSITFLSALKPVSAVDINLDGSEKTIVDGDTVYLAFQDSSSGIFEVYFAKSTDGGSTYGEPVSVSQTPDSDSFISDMAVDSVTGNIYIVWQEYASGYSNIYFGKSVDGGLNFSVPVNVSQTEFDSSAGKLALDNSGNVYVSWEYYVFNPDTFEVIGTDIFIVGSSDAGDSFGCPINVSNSKAFSSGALISAASGGGLDISWDEATEAGTESRSVSGIDPFAPSVIIDRTSNTNPLWGKETVEVSGILANTDPGDTISVNWGDSTTDSGLEISGCSWGPVSHLYDETAALSGQLTIDANIVGNDEAQTIKGTSPATQIEIRKHETSLVLDPILSLKSGQEISIHGILTDSSDEDTPVVNKNVSFAGSATDILAVTAIETNSTGQFSVTIEVPDLTEDGLSLVAQFAGNELYEPKSSAAQSFDIVSQDAVEIPVPNDPNVKLALGNYGGATVSLQIEQVEDSGSILVGSCDSPESERYVGLGICLQISPSFTMLEGTAALVNISYSGVDLQGYGGDDLSIFHRSADGSITDVTSLRDGGHQFIIGKVSSFSKFILGAAVHEEFDIGSHRLPLVLGDGNLASIRNIDDTTNSTSLAKIGLDKERYRMGDDAVLTIEDNNENVDATASDITVARIFSTTSSPAQLILTLSETGPNTGVFEGTFKFVSSATSNENKRLQVSSNDKISIMYVSGARFEAEIDGITEAGFAELTDSIVPSGVCFSPIGRAINLGFVDAQKDNSTPITITMSYANSILSGRDPSTLLIYHEQDQIWDSLGTISYSAANKTVTAESTTTGAFSLGFNTGCTGGAGGGFGKGVIVDAVASIAKSASSGGGGSGGSSGSNSVTSSSSVTPGSDSKVTATLSSTSSVTLQFANVLTPGGVTVEQKSISSLSSLFTEINQNGSMIGLSEGSVFTTVGNLFDIKPSSGLSYEGMIEITLPYDSKLLGGSSPSDVRLLHYDEKTKIWEDTTTSINAGSGTVTGQVSSLSPFVVAVSNDGTFAAAYFEQNPMTRIIDIDDATGHASIAGGSITLLNQDGSKISASINSGSKISFVNTIKNVQRTPQSYTYILEIFDKQGVVVELQTAHSGTLQNGQSSKIISEWTPADSGKYTFKVIVVDDLAKSAPLLLKNFLSTTLEVV